MFVITTSRSRLSSCWRHISQTREESDSSRILIKNFSAFYLAVGINFISLSLTPSTSIRPISIRSFLCQLIIISLARTLQRLRASTPLFHSVETLLFLTVHVYDAAQSAHKWWRKLASHWSLERVANRECFFFQLNDDNNYLISRLLMLILCLLIHLSTRRAI